MNYLDDISQVDLLFAQLAEALSKTSQEDAMEMRDIIERQVEKGVVGGREAANLERLARQAVAGNENAMRELSDLIQRRGYE